MIGIVLTAALFLVAFGKMMLGPLTLPLRDGRTGFTDLRTVELVPVVSLLVLSLLVGVLPRLLLDVIEPGARAVVALVGR